MQNLIKELEGKIIDQLITEGKDPQDESIKASIAEWKLMKKKIAVIDKIGKAITSRIAELEEGFEEVVKSIDGNKTVIDGAILEYTQKKGNTTVKYKEVVDYSLKMVNEAQKKVIESFITSVTKSGEIKSILSVTDPELEKYLLDLKDVTGDELMDKIEVVSRASFDRFPKQVANSKKRELKEDVVKNIATVAKHLVSGFKRVFSVFFSSMKSAEKATASLLKAVKADPLKESTEELAEMAASRSFTSGYMKSSNAKALVKAFKAGEETYEFKNGRSFKADKAIRGDKLETGMVVLASYDSTNQGAQIYEVLGFTDPTVELDDPKFKTAKEAMTACKVTSLKALSNLGQGEASKMVVKDLEDGDEGAWFYAYNGSWARGSGAEKLSFTLVEEVK